MEKRQKIRLYLPKPEDLWFRRSLLEDPETMSYNRAWGGPAVCLFLQEGFVVESVTEQIVTVAKKL